MRRLTLSVAALLLCFAVAIAAAEDKKPEPAKKLDGKELFKTNCKSCHDAKSPHGEYTPMTYIGEQWERFFDEKLAETHKAVVDTTRGAEPLLKLITPEELKEMRKFCVDHAADSEHPMTCG